MDVQAAQERRSRQVSRERYAGTLGPEVVHPNDPGEHHPALQAGRVAVVTGAANGIGLAAAQAFAELGMRVALADVSADALRTASEALAKEYGAQNVLAVEVDVSDAAQVETFKDKVFEWGGEVAVLLNNAGTSASGTSSWNSKDKWRKILDTNLWGVINVQLAFVSSMLCQENPSLIINTGSKQGITNPPGNAPYNASKAAVKSITETLAHELREANGHLTAHLFIPGWTHTGIRGVSADSRPKPDGAWTAEQTVAYMLERVRLGDFYILCPDNETSGALDRLRIRWGMEDLIEGRPALSRWHPEYKPLFEEYIRAGLVSEQ